ncbi:MAG: lipoate--protein ligase family protein [Candidatus Altiarchaeota archaeon]|nr:lipoate--protein ligase family protein [Candidatus Altiarchaeota archaeon]
MKWRFIGLDKVDGVLGPAIFEAVMDSIRQDLVDDTLLFWRPIKPAVYIGYHQKAYEDLHVDRCKRMEIPIVRRVLGGGTGFCDENQIIYNVIFREDRDGMPYGPREVYRFILNGVIAALNSLGVGDAVIDDERFSVYANGRKISGSGQLTSKGVVNSSGSLLVDFDFKTMCFLLKNPVKNLREGIRKPEEGMTCLRREVEGITMDEVKKALLGGFEHILGEAYEGALTDHELELAENLRNKYLTDEWIFRADLREWRRKRNLRT